MVNSENRPWLEESNHRTQPWQCLVAALQSPTWAGEAKIKTDAQTGLLKRLTTKIDAVRNQYVVGPHLTYAEQWERIKKALRTILHAETKKMREKRKARVAGDHELVALLQKRSDRGLLDSTGLDRLEEAIRRGPW